MPNYDLPVSVLKEFLLYDPASGDLFWRERERRHFVSNRGHKTWNARYAGKKAFTSITNAGYHLGSVLKERYLAHRVIWAMMTGEWPKNEIDHINGVRTDNRWCNLRHVTRRQNTMNKAIRSNNKSGVCGVFHADRGSPWIAQITHKGKRIHLGGFATKEEAVLARKKAEADLKYHPNHGREPTFTAK